MKFKKFVGGKYQETVEFRFRDIEVIEDAAYIKTKSGILQCIDCDDETEHNVEIIGVDLNQLKRNDMSKAEEILKSIGYDNNKITTTEKWIAEEVYNSLQSEIDELKAEVERLKGSVRTLCVQHQELLDHAVAGVITDEDTDGYKQSIEILNEVRNLINQQND